MNNRNIENTNEFMKEFSEPSSEAASAKEESILPNNLNTSFNSYKEFSDLPAYFTDSYEYLTEIFEKLGDGSLRNDLSSEDRDRLIALLEKYKDNMLETMQKATLSLTNDITSIKRKKVVSSVDTSSLKSLIHGSTNSKLSYSSHSTFVEPENQ